MLVAQSGYGSDGSNSGLLIFVLIVWAIAGPVVGALIGKPKGREGTGVLLGFFLGVIGWVIVAVLPATADVEAARLQRLASALRQPSGGSSSGTRRPCPWCAEDIMTSAVVCRFCGRAVEPLPYAPPAPSTQVPSHWSISQGEFQQLADAFPVQVAQVEAQDKLRPLTGLSRWELKNLVDCLAAGYDYATALNRTRPSRR